MATRYTSIGTAALVASAIGASLYTASSAETARQAISAAHDPTTRHGELVTRTDAGGADVTALAPVAPGTAGQVLTVSDAGLPHWAAAAAGGSSLPDAAGVADGAVLATVGGAQTWTQMWPGAVSADPMTGSGWTTSGASGGRTATWAAGKLTLAIPSSNATQVDVQSAALVDTGATAWDLAVRLQLIAGSGDNSGVTGVYLLNAGRTLYAGINVRGDGATDVLYASTSTGFVASFSAAQFTGGQAWVRISRDVSGRWTWWWGVGSGGALPTSWTRRHTLDVAANATGVEREVALTLAGNPTSAVPFTVDVLDIRSSWSGAL